MKTGDYVRTKDGIERIIYIKGRVNFQGYEKIISTDKNKYETIYEHSKILKSSPNIINLIEIGDYVNGVLVTKRMIDNLEMYFNDIKSIVTKEQFESMEYKVGE